MKVIIPPIKSQGIKTKLVPWITAVVPEDFEGVWIEPFMGTGVVAFNIARRRALLCDTNPHLLNFYGSLLDGRITASVVRSFLRKEGRLLLEKGESHYYEVRERFNRHHRPLDFLFLNRSCFNGVIRFNRRGDLNIPFCRKPQRFAQAYITKIVNQVDHLAMVLSDRDFVFKCQSFEKTISESTTDDIIYCDPPYIDRHADYYNGWNLEHERSLFEALSNSPCRFIVSTWHHNDYRENEYIKSLWSRFHVVTHEHFYHVGGSETNRNTMVEAIVTNFNTSAYRSRRSEQGKQRMLFESSLLDT